MRLPYVFACMLLFGPYISSTAAQSIFIHWDKPFDGIALPRLDRIDPEIFAPSNPLIPETSATLKHSNASLESTLNETQEISNETNITGQYWGTLDMTGKAPIEKLSIKQMRSLLALEKVPCDRCIEKREMVEAVRKHLDLISIRSIKNFLAVRGLRCPECKDKADLVRKAWYGAHLPHLNVSLPVFVIENCWLFPGGELKMLMVEPRFETILRQIQHADRRVGIMGSYKGGVIARITSLQPSPEGGTVLTVVGEQRFATNGQPLYISNATNPARLMADGTLFVDDPLFPAQAIALRELHKQTRRAFHAADTDAWAEARRALLIGNPPDDRRGPEPFSHWLATAAGGKRHREHMFFTTETAARLVAARAAIPASRFARGRRPDADGAGAVAPAEGDADITEEDMAAAVAAAQKIGAAAVAGALGLPPAASAALANGMLGGKGPAVWPRANLTTTGNATVGAMVSDAQAKVVAGGARQRIEGDSEEDEEEGERASETAVPSSKPKAKAPDSPRARSSQPRQAPAPSTGAAKAKPSKAESFDTKKSRRAETTTGPSSDSKKAESPETKAEPPDTKTTNRAEAKAAAGSSAKSSPERKAKASEPKAEPSDTKRRRAEAAKVTPGSTAKAPSSSEGNARPSNTKPKLVEAATASSPETKAKSSSEAKSAKSTEGQTDRGRRQPLQQGEAKSTESDAKPSNKARKHYEASEARPTSSETKAEPKAQSSESKGKQSSKTQAKSSEAAKPTSSESKAPAPPGGRAGPGRRAADGAGAGTNSSQQADAAAAGGTGRRRLQARAGSRGSKA